MGCPKKVAVLVRWWLVEVRLYRLYSLFLLFLLSSKVTTDVIMVSNNFT